MDFDPKTVEGVVKKVFKNLGEDLEKSTVLKEAVKLLIDKDEKKAESKAKKRKWNQQMKIIWFARCKKQDKRRNQSMNFS